MGSENKASKDERIAANDEKASRAARQGWKTRWARMQRRRDEANRAAGLVPDGNGGWRKDVSIPKE